MSDLIRLLPDSVANQIAAGEVIQRPASAVKELLENAVDAGATSVKLIIKEAGKTLIQVIDNGCGMSETDARMCFERHATSKIQTANDLLAIRTLGFRGEALASIASIAQVEIKTRRTEDEIGTFLQIDGSEFKMQLPDTCPAGTSISVKNLFFNVPARRNFLKSNALELKYIIEEFFRVALVNHDIGFTFYNNDKILFQIPASNLKQRLVSLFGSNYNQRLVPVELESAIVNISGFIGKPEFAKKTRGEQYFFTNGRFIKSAYLHHAVENAFQELVPKDAFPGYFLYLEIDPKNIDINIHPTKTEINFQDSKSIYAILLSAVRQAIGKFNMTPSLDFEREPSMDPPLLSKDQVIRQPTITINPDYNPFEKAVKPQGEIPFSQRERSNQENWQKLYDPLRNFPSSEGPQERPASQHILKDLDGEAVNKPYQGTFQAQNRFIITHILNGIVIIDQQNAHERVLYEKFTGTDPGHAVDSQKLLIPQTISLSHSDAELYSEYQHEFEELGFEITVFGKNSFLVSAAPSGCQDTSLPDVIERMLEILKDNPEDLKTKSHSQLAISLAKSLSVKRGVKLQQEEIFSLVESLFTCKVPEMTMDGKPTMVKVSYEELQKTFR
jgi:DNA mismatch repair protein MutL